jgi:phosphoribosyl 1,2-cyclic phosphate phosphodiesterase
MQTTLTILGCGSSLGVPIIGCKCPVCLSASPYNKRRRSSILISSNSTKILIDAGPDIRNQLLGADINDIDALIITHDHADHTSGIDDMRIFRLIYGKRLDIYAETQTINSIAQDYNYLISIDAIKLHAIEFGSKLKIGDIELQFFCQDHGTMDSLGIRIGSLVYANDVITFPKESKKYLRNADTIIMDCVDYKSLPTHSGLDLVMQWAQEFEPKQIYLTNMSHRIDYFDIQAKLPYNIRPAYDGLKIQCLPRA